MSKHSVTPNILTWLRLVSAPVLVVAFMTAPTAWRDIAAAIIFLFAMSTDFLDGYWARRYNATSRFGEFLDPVADKIVVTTALLLLLTHSDNTLLLPTLILPTLIIVCREICVSALREWMAMIGERQEVKVSNIGKWKTVFQIAAITMLLYNAPLYGIPLPAIGIYLLWAAALLTLWSMILYLRAARRFMVDAD